MRIIITGGSGLIGRAFIHNLTADKHEVIVLSRRPQQVTGLPAGARAAAWSELNTDGVDAIVNLAGESIAGDNPLTGRWTPARKQAMRTSRIEATQAVVEAVRRARVKPGVVLQASAVGYYGACGDEIVTEDHPAGTDFLAQICREWEQASAPLDELGVRRVILRTGLPLSREGGALRPLILLFSLFAGGPLGNGRQWWPWLHMRDQVGAMRFLLDNPQARGPFNLAAPNPLTNADFSRALGRAMGRPAFLPAPAFALRLALGEMADALLLSGQRLSPARLQALGYSFQFPEAEAALRDVLR